MYYYKKLNENGTVVALLTYDFKPNITDPLIIEITVEEYTALIEEINKEPEPSDDDEISGREFLEMIEEVL